MVSNRFNRIQIVQIILLICVSIFIFSNTFENSFMWDDKDLIVEDRYIRSLKNIPNMFSLNYWKHFNLGSKGQYRPIRTVTFALDYSLWGLNPKGFHATNLFLHIVNVLLVYYFIWLLLSGERNTLGLYSIPFLTAIFFAVHPIHTESVSWIKNRSDILALIFYLISLVVFIRSILNKTRWSVSLSYGISLLCFVLACMSKEMALSLPLVMILYIWIFRSSKDRKQMVIKTVPYFILIVCVLGFKFIAFGAVYSSGGTQQINLYQNALVVFKTMGTYLFLLIFPVNLNAERVLNIPKSFLEPGVFVSALILLVSIFMVKKFKRSKLLAFGIGWILLTLIPVSNIIFLSGRQLAEQRLYIPSLGFCLIIAWILTKISLIQRKAISLKWLARILAVLVLVQFAPTTYQRNFDWKDSLVFWSKTVEQSPMSARAHYNLGNAYSETSKNEQAIDAYKKAINIEPHSADSHYNMGNVYMSMNKMKEALKTFQKAVELDPKRADAINNLGVVYQSLGQRDKAQALYTKAIRVNPHYANSYVNLGLYHLKSGNNKEAAHLFNEALQYNPYYSEAYNNLGIVLERLGKREEAYLTYKKATEIKPDYADAYYNMGILQFNRGNSKEAEFLFQKTTVINPDHADAFYNLGKLHTMNSEFEDAIKMFQQSIAIKPHWDVYAEIGKVYLYLGNQEKADEYIAKAKEMMANGQ